MAQQPVELILARQLAGCLAVPVLLVDASGTALFFNEPAEQIFGRRFDEIEALGLEERTKSLAPRRQNGEVLPPDELPAVVAMRERRPAHAAFVVHGFDGVRHPVEATGIPLETAGGHVVGALVVLWAHPDAADSSAAGAQRETGSGA